MLRSAAIMVWALYAASPPELPEPDSGTPEVVVQWSAPTSCPEQSQVEQQLSAYLGPRADQPRARGVRGLHVGVQVTEASGSRWVAELSLDGRDGPNSRTIEAKSCDVLAKAVALIAAMQVDALATSAQIRESMSTSSSDPTIVPPVVNQTITTRDRPRTQREAEDDGLAQAVSPSVDTKRPRATGLLRLVGVGGWVALPRVAGGLGLAGGIRWPKWRLEVEVDSWFPREIPHPTNAAITGSFLQVITTVRGCRGLTLGPVEIPLCVGIRAGGLRGVGREGVTEPNPTWAGWVGATLEPAIVWSPIPRLGLFAGVGTMVSFVTPRFIVGTEPLPLLDLQRFGAQVSVGFELYLPPYRPG